MKEDPLLNAIKGDIITTFWINTFEYFSILSNDKVVKRLRIRQVNGRHSIIAISYSEVVNLYFKSR